MFHMHQLAAVFIAIAIAVVPVGSAASQDRDLMFRLSYVADIPDCPAVQAFTDQVVSRVGYFPFADTADVEVEVRIAERSGSLEGELRLEGGGHTGSRSFEAGLGECEDLVTAMAFALVLRIDPVRSTRDVGGSRGSEDMFNLLVDTGPTAPDSDTIRDYKRRVLRRQLVQITMVSSINGAVSSSTRLDWNIMNGNEKVFNAEEFAEVTGDQAMVGKIISSNRRVLAGGLIGLGITTGVMGAGAVVGGTSIHKSEKFVGYSETESRQDFTISLILLTAGGFSTTLVCFILRAETLMRSHPAYWYDDDEVNERIDAHNSELREELGLSNDETILLDLVSRQPSIEFTPYIGLGSVGVSGRF